MDALNKDMARLIRLHEEYEKQRNRVIAIIQYNIKKIGLNIVCDYLKVKPPYLSGFSRFSTKGTGKYISHDKLVDVYKAIIEIDEILKPESKNESN